MPNKVILLLFFLLIFAATGVSYAAFPKEYDKAADISLNDITVDTGAGKLMVSMTRPAKPLTPFLISFKFPPNADIKSLSYTTNMEMNMGRFNPSIKANVDKTYSIELTLPKCGSGRTLWYGKLDIGYASGGTESVIFFYDVK